MSDTPPPPEREPDGPDEPAPIRFEINPFGPPEPAADEQVGYRRPPHHTRFRKGVSGNPRGRPKGSRNVQALIQAELKAKVPVVVAGRRRMITKAEALAKTLVNNALKGDPRAMRTLVGMAAAADEAADRPDDQTLAENDRAILEAYRRRSRES